jgi:hypothetical protein
VIVPFIAIAAYLIVIYSVFSARSVKHIACADHVFALSLDDKFRLSE